MQGNNTKFYFKQGFFFLCAIFALLFPLKWILAWIIAMGVHELFHYIALRLFNITVYEISPGLRGVIMKTEALPIHVEIISALAGPIGGLSLLLFSHWLPYVAICAAVQSAFNLLPLYPLDGGRVLLGVLEMVFNEHGMKIYVVIKWFIIALMSICAIAAVYLGLGIIPIIIVSFIILKSSCKHE